MGRYNTHTLCMVVVSFGIGCFSSDQQKMDDIASPFELEEKNVSAGDLGPDSDLKKMTEDVVYDVIIETQDKHPWAEGYDTVHFHPKEQAIAQAEEARIGLSNVFNSEYSIRVRNTDMSDMRVQTQYQYLKQDYYREGEVSYMGLGRPFIKGDDLHLFECSRKDVYEYAFNDVYVRCMLIGNEFMTYVYSPENVNDALDEFVKGSIVQQEKSLANQECLACEEGLYSTNVYFYVKSQNKGTVLKQYIFTEKKELTSISIDHNIVRLTNENN